MTRSSADQLIEQVLRGADPRRLVEMLVPTPTVQKINALAHKMGAKVRHLHQ